MGYVDSLFAPFSPFEPFDKHKDRPHLLHRSPKIPRDSAISLGLSSTPKSLNFRPCAGSTSPCGVSRIRKPGNPYGMIGSDHLQDLEKNLTISYRSPFASVTISPSSHQSLQSSVSLTRWSSRSSPCPSSSRAWRTWRRCQPRRRSERRQAPRGPATAHTDGSGWTGGPERAWDGGTGGGRVQLRLASLSECRELGDSLGLCNLVLPVPCLETCK